MIKNIRSNFQITKFKKGDFGIFLGKETFYNAYYAGKARRNPSSITMSIIADALSAYIKKDSIINAADFTLPNEKFIRMYPEEIIGKQEDAAVRYELFENKLFRCYYLLPGANKHAMIGYFKIFRLHDGSMTAYLLRGIGYFDDTGKIDKEDDRNHSLRNLINSFEAPDTLKRQFTFYKNQYKEKQDERIHLYSANNENIYISKACIKIDFSVFDTPSEYRSTMFWNIEPITKTKGIGTVIGGLALVVDTNDGDRQMCAYKMGLDAVGVKDNRCTCSPIYCEMSSIFNELSLSADKTVYVLDRVEDTLWYHYIQDATNREIPSKKYSQEDFEIMVENFDKMKRDYSEHIFELKNLIEGLKEKLNDRQSGKP